MLNLDINYDFTTAFKWDEIVTNTPYSQMADTPEKTGA